MLRLGSGMVLAGVIAASVAFGDPHADIAAAEDQFAEVFNSGDPEAIALVYSEDVVVHAPGWKPTQGREAIANMYGAFFKAGYHNSRPEVQSISFAGDDTAIVVVHDHVQRRDGNGDVTDHAFKALRVWQKNGDGDWLLYRESFNDLPGG